MGLLIVLPVLAGCGMIGRHGVAPLHFGSLTPDKEAPAATGVTTVHWIASATGGVGDLRYEFRTLKNAEEIVEQEGASPTWEWTPKKPGIFQVKVTVEDGAGTRVDSDWSSAYVIRPPVDKEMRIAILPTANLSGTKAPLELIPQALRSGLERNCFHLIDHRDLEQFMNKHRIRYTGGINSKVSKAIREETGAEAVLITSLETYRDGKPLKISLISRLVLSGEYPEILWMDSVGLSGEESPGLLGLGKISEPEVLLEKATRYLTDSLVRYLAEPEQTISQASVKLPSGCEPEGKGIPLSVGGEEGVKRKYKPKNSFRSSIFDPSRRYSVAVIPFRNLSGRKHAGTIVTLHFVDRLTRNEIFEVIEPGLVREQLLRYRITMEAGPSLAVADLMSSQGSLGVNLIMSGTVFDYQDVFGVPKVDFSVKIIEEKSREIVWLSRSLSNGNEGVFFFDLGAVHTAHGLTSEMVKGAIATLTR